MVFDRSFSNAIRMLSVDAIQKSNSGHPGMPMGMADISEVLWCNFLKHNPKNPYWINRDRFILSNGHGSMLLYSILHLTGYNISIDDISNFRQLNSITPGHPEYNHTPGVECTTGPLGQGLANGVGFAIAERILSLKFNKLNYNIFDHKTYVFVGDGCLMEGISHESCSLAGHLKLGKLIVFYDNNGISIDGNTKDWFSDNNFMRFTSYGWHVIDNIDGHNFNDIYKSIKLAISEKHKPSLLIFNTIIGFGSPNKSNSSIVHGECLGDSEIIETRKNLNWNYESFVIPDKIYSHWNFVDKGFNLESNWMCMLYNYKKKYPDLFYEFKRRYSKLLPSNFLEKINFFIKHNLNKNLNLSTRLSSNFVLEYIGNILFDFLGGSADLSPSNLTKFSLSTSFNGYNVANYIHYGVREFAMTSITNGISLYGFFIPYSATFLVFSQYALNAVRMAALMNIRNLFIYTHDSICVGEDGPTHQPVEHLVSLRSIPNLIVWRPCDIIETIIAWVSSIKCLNKPSVLILSRQSLIHQNRSKFQISNIYNGGYILLNCFGLPEIIFISTGSDLNLVMNVARKMIIQNVKVRVISMPSTNLFDLQCFLYQEYLLPKYIYKKFALESSVSDFWCKYVGVFGYIIGVDCFGKSASLKDIFKEFGFYEDYILNKVKLYLN